ncbi:MAG TPA: hypothetical protein EYH38_06355 [Leucothrix sp.]|nr:hypothetical protein [Leucothrix sp.]
MSNSTIRKLVLSIILTFGSFLSLPSYAWPEVDHMNMCGPAAKISRTYGGEFKGWQSRDRYVANNRRAGYYYRNNCPETVAPVKKIVKKVRKVRKSKKRSRYVTKCKYVKRCRKVKRTKKRVSKKYPYIAKSSKARKFKRTVKYDKHADCVQVDRVNTTGSAVKVVRRR